MVADTIRTCCRDDDLKGHIGGDDFVIVSPLCQPDAVRALCGRITFTFGESIRSLYNEEDWNRGYIISQNRHGFTENFPIAALSIAVVTNSGETFAGMEELSRAVAVAKKKSKHKQP